MTDELTNWSLTRSDDGIAHLELDRRHRMNAIDMEMLREFEPAVTALQRDPPEALVLSGAGSRAFSIGMDVNGDAFVEDADKIDEVTDTGARSVNALERLGLPVVAAVDGAAYGGGLEIALAADLRIAGESTTVASPEIEYGFMPGWGATQRLPRIVGTTRAKELLFTGDPYDADQLAEWGLFNDVVPDGDVSEVAFDLAADLAEKPGWAFDSIKSAMRAGTPLEASTFERERSQHWRRAQRDGLFVDDVDSIDPFE